MEKAKAQARKPTSSNRLELNEMKAFKKLNQAFYWFVMARINNLRALKFNYALGFIRAQLGSSFKSLKVFGPVPPLVEPFQIFLSTLLGSDENRVNPSFLNQVNPSCS